MKRLSPAGMQVIFDIYVQKCNHPSDINQLLPFLKEFSDKVDHITEMGVRQPTSTYAFLASKASKIISYDIATQPEVAECIKHAENANRDFTYIEADVLKVDIEETDFLFIDTFHTYTQLKAELKKHASKARKFIGFHDTTTFAFKGEDAYETVAHNQTNCGRGLWAAIEEFLAENPEWSIAFKTEINNGLTILEKK